MQQQSSFTLGLVACRGSSHSYSVRVVVKRAVSQFPRGVVRRTARESLISRHTLTGSNCERRIHSMMDNQLKNDRLRKVCRKLFQDDNDDDNEQQKHCDIRESILEEIRIQAERDEKKWNFNFIREKPLPGRYEWVGPNDEIPEENEISDFKETNEKIQNDQEEYAEETKNNAENIYNKSNENDAERSN